MPEQTELQLISGDTTARELQELLGAARLTLYGQGCEWSAVVWLDQKTWGVGSGGAWYLAADRALRHARGKRNA